MALIKPIEVIQSRLSEVPIKHGQILFCTDTNDIYMDSSEGSRVQMSDIIKLATEEERESMFVPLIGKIYLVEESNKLYSYNGLDWETISIDISINDNTVEYTELTPGILEKKGVKYAPKTLASVVYLEDGDTVSNKIQQMEDSSSSLSYTKNQTITHVETARIEIGISGFNKDEDLLLVYKNSVYIEENIEFIISPDSLYIEKIDGTWNKSGTSCFNFIVLKKLKYKSPEYSDIKDHSITERMLSLELLDKINSYQSKINELTQQIQELQSIMDGVLIVNT